MADAQKQDICFLKIFSEVKGYHIFKIRPLVDVAMLVLPEPHNMYDSNAMLVKMPGFQELSHHGAVAEDKVKEVADKVVGRVPANLCGVMTGVLPYCKEFKW